MNALPRANDHRVGSGILAVVLSAVLAAPLATADDDIERRLHRIERLLDSGALAELSNRQERLQRNISQLLGEVESMNRELEEVQRQQRNLFEDLDDRLMELEQAAAAAPETPTHGDGMAPVVPETPTLDAAVAGEDTGTPDADTDAEAADAYSRAFSLLRDGDYQRAGDGFREILESHPDSDYADNARYWLAETYYVVRDFDEAMEHFQRIVDNPDSNKHPDALLKAGYIHYEREEWDEARGLLEQVREDYPDSTVASLAGNRLDQMDEDGR